MTAIRTEELSEICRATPLPVIVKGVLSLHDARQCMAAGAAGMVLSHHNNRIEYAVPPLAMLPEIAAIAGETPLFVDCEIKTGMDAFKALSLGAKGVCIGRPLMTAIKKGGADAVRDYLASETDALRKAMAYTGCADLNHMDPTVIRRI
jgi:isopentenyl diphosphate isomerase/L-lactate dehydrogenase-like FMN-dependent dehydrogenase